MRPSDLLVHALHARFNNAMDLFKPFEARPHIVVAVSGGPDSMALALLAKNWVAARDGQATALIVDHRLRQESRDEAVCVQQRLRALKIRSEVLVWRGEKPATGVQAAARAARYQLLDQWCAQNGVLHVLTGHHTNDQAETVAMRSARGSGLEGLAGMSAIVEHTRMRLLRPLLGFDRDGLRDFLEDQGVPWLVDPSNRDLRFERARLRQGNPLSCHPREETRQTGATRRALEGRVQTALAACVAPHPFGFCGVNLSNFIKEDPTVVDGMLSRVVAWIGGRNYLLAPALATQLRSQLPALKPGQSATAGGCLITRRKETVVITRELGRLPSVRKMDLRSGDLWDGRFWLEADPTQGGQDRPFNIGPLGSTGVRDVVRSNDLASVSGIPKAAIAALPALWVDGVAVCVPHLFIQRAGESQFSAVFRPRRTLSSPTFAVA